MLNVLRLVSVGFFNASNERRCMMQAGHDQGFSLSGGRAPQ
jgi:hypothetical protein